MMHGQKNIKKIPFLHNSGSGCAA